MSANPGYPLYLDWLPAALERDARCDAAAVVPHHRTHRQQPRHCPLQLQTEDGEDFTITE